MEFVFSFNFILSFSSACVHPRWEQQLISQEAFLLSMSSRKVTDYRRKEELGTQTWAASPSWSNLGENQYDKRSVLFQS